MKPQAEVGIFGGSGFYSLSGKTRRIEALTDFGAPSASPNVSQIAGRNVAFLPRHGVHHEYPPHMIPYRANIQAFKQLGVTRVMGPCAVGSLKASVKPGDLVFCDQFVNLTTGREDTFYNGPETAHVSVADPYCPEMRRIGIEAAEKLGLKAHEAGTVVVIQGPRFSTRAESRFFSAQGWDVINMTQYPEAVLAREMELCYLNVSLVTDYDAGLECEPEVKPVSNEEVIKVFNRNLERLRALIDETVRTLPKERGCGCGQSMKHARMGAK